MEAILTDSQKPHPAIRNFTPEQWDEMSEKLMGFTFRFFQNTFSGNIKNAHTPDGSTYQDIAQEIVLRVLMGARRWNPDKDGELLPYMAGQVKSLVNHEFYSWNARNVETMSEKNASNDKEFPDKDLSNKSQPYPFIDPEIILIGHEHQIDRDRLLNTVVEAAVQTKDEELISLVEAYLDESGKYKPQEIAARLGIPTTEFHNRRKRLVRCVQKYLLDQSSETGERNDK